MSDGPDSEKRELKTARQRELLRLGEAAPPLTKRFDDALTFARVAHVSHQRKGTSIPYLSHLLAVSAIVLEMGGDEDEAIAALLHDAVEDSPFAATATLAAIRAQFGDDVARIVEANSDPSERPMPPWRERKQAYVETLATKQPDELRVALADKLHNIRAVLLDQRAIGDAVWERFKQGRESQLWYYGELLREFTARADDLGPGAAAKLDDFRRAVEELSA